MYVFTDTPWQKYEIITCCSTLHSGEFDGCRNTNSRLTISAFYWCTQYVLMYGSNCKEYYLIYSPVESSECIGMFMLRALRFLFYHSAVIVYSVQRWYTNTYTTCGCWTRVCMVCMVHFDNIVFGANEINFQLQAQANVKHFSIY